MSPAKQRPAAAASTIPSGEELVARARALAVKLKERAVRAERDRNIPQKSVDEYIAAGSGSGSTRPIRCSSHPALRCRETAAT